MLYLGNQIGLLQLGSQMSHLKEGRQTLIDQ